ncbi:hypothetical protein RCL1_008430 [Eukaryota sp. TZLM3-RCL]
MSFSLKAFVLHRHSDSVCLNRLGVKDDDLSQFSDFPQLTTVWLQGNLLTRIIGLDACFRLRTLMLSNNEISSLSGSLQSLRHIRRLCLAHNFISDVNHVCNSLKHLLYLEDLNLVHNPVTFEPNYRKIIIKTIPSLVVFDLKKVSRSSISKGHSQVAFGKTLSQSEIDWGQNHSTIDPFADSKAVSLLRRSVTQHDKRKQECLVEKPLNEGNVSLVPLPKELDYLGHEKRLQVVRQSSPPRARSSFVFSRQSLVCTSKQNCIKNVNIAL